MRRLAILALALLGGAVPIAAFAVEGDSTDPARNLAIPCEYLSGPATAARSNRNISHVANVCGIVGTDVELQSRRDLNGLVHDYAFVGTMGAGFRIFDVTDPDHPKHAGGYADTGWENDVQVAGDIVVATFDGVSGEDSSASTCLKTRYPNANGQGIDIYRLDYNELTAAFETNLLTCVANPPGGAHNVTIHPGADYLTISNCCSDWALDLVDLRGGNAVHRWRFLDEGKQDASRCPTGAAFTCVVVTRPDGSSAKGLWQPHDIHFSRDGKTGYVAAIKSTFIVDVSKALNGGFKTLAIIPNVSEPGADASHNITISHQADVTPDGKILIVSDEEGGGLSNTDCNTTPNGLVGALHFWALAPLQGLKQTAGASASSPKKFGVFVNPRPPIGPDPLSGILATLPRAERACTVHVFRIGGNGTSSPGEIVRGDGGVSTLPTRQLTTAWYGAGVWWVDFSGPPRSDDGIAEDARTTWGNTLGWSVMPGADTWSAKEYKGHVYAGDILRGFDVYRLAR
ncbi:MAG: hypothetical protein QOI67_1379 [Gaiellaceae bacterium]|jgi:hypothetical protein|nr:hypothetical protein [Gaiellaceae bacterium]